MSHALPGAWRRGAAALVGSALVITSFGSVTASARPSPADLPADLLPAANCVAGGPTTTLTVLGFNDFHGRIGVAGRVFTEVEKARAAAGEANVLTLSSGDNIGGSTFESASQDDKPTLDVLNAGALDVSTVGNHEFDKGWSDITDRVVPGTTFPWLGANVYTKGTSTVAAPLKEYQIFEKAGLRVAVVGAVTADVPSMVSPAGITAIDVGDPVQAINRVAAQLKDGNDANGEADIVIASLHEGAPNSTDPAAAAAESPAFNAIYNQITANSDLVFNAHTHQTYNWTTNNNGVPLLQAGSYGEKVAKVDLVVDTDDHQVCAATPTLIETAGTTEDTSFARVASIKQIVDTAVAQAEVVGAEVIGNATGPITLPGGLMTPDQRDKESPATNMVAQMFYEVLSNGNTEFIGVQNPGGTRAGIDAGEVTYKEAALTLPFANTLQTTQLTGAQFKTVLEQQWQRDAAGNVPSRPYLRLGLSSNVSYTYEEGLAEGNRITSISINGAPINPTKLYTVGSGSFLIAGGDNFRAFQQGVNTRDTGQVDLTAMVDWVKAKKTLTPSYIQTGVSLSAPSTISDSQQFNVALGNPSATGVAPDTLNSTGQGAPANTSVDFTVIQGTTKIALPQQVVTEGSVSSRFTLPPFSGLTAGPATITALVQPSGQLVSWPVSVTVGAKSYLWGDQTGDKIGDVVTIDAEQRLHLYPGWRSEAMSGADALMGRGWGAMTWIGRTPDVSGDGIDDIVAVRNDGLLFYYRSLGEGRFAPAVQFGHGWNMFQTLAVIGDMNGDKLPELVGVAKDGRLLRYTVTGKGMVGTAVIGRGWGGMAHLVGTGSLDLNTSADIVAVRKDGVLLAYNSSAAGVPMAGKPIGSGWQKFDTVFSAGDMDGNGTRDLIGRLPTGQLHLYHNRGRGSFVSPSDISTPAGLNFTGHRLFA